MQQPSSKRRRTSVLYRSSRGGNTSCDVQSSPVKSAIENVLFCGVNSKNVANVPFETRRQVISLQNQTQTASRQHYKKCTVLTIIKSIGKEGAQAQDVWTNTKSLLYKTRNGSEQKGVLSCAGKKILWFDSRFESESYGQANAINLFVQHGRFDHRL